MKNVLCAYIHTHTNRKAETNHIVPSYTFKMKPWWMNSCQLKHYNVLELKNRKAERSRAFCTHNNRLEKKKKTSDLASARLTFPLLIKMLYRDYSESFAAI